MDIVRKERPQNRSPEQALLESIAFAKDGLFDGVRRSLALSRSSSPANTRDWLHP